MIIIGVIAYIAAAAVAMYWSTRLSNKSQEYTEAPSLFMISILWPIAFPLYVAYTMGACAEDGE